MIVGFVTVPLPVTAALTCMSNVFDLPYCFATKARKISGMELLQLLRSTHPSICSSGQPSHHQVGAWCACWDPPLSKIAGVPHDSPLEGQSQWDRYLCLNNAWLRIVYCILILNLPTSLLVDSLKALLQTAM